MQDIKDLRREFSRASLDVSNVEKDPIRQFENWFEEAVKAEVMDVNAMSLSTINADNRPSNRIVLLKGVEQGGFLFYTNYQSKKGRELALNPACALTFFWPELERQVRIEGSADRVADVVSDEYFNSRPRGSQIGAWASPQSSPIINRAILEERAMKLEEKFKDDLIPRPKQWGGYYVTPLLIEFWQGRPNRLHDRIEYVKTDNEWVINRLAP